jgi:hypothetical protein
VTPLAVDVLTKRSSQHREGLESTARGLMERALQFVGQWPWLGRV